jgi:hypothetical protein
VEGSIGRSPSSIEREGLDPLQVGSRLNPVALSNKSSKKFGTLTDYVHARTADLSNKSCKKLKTLTDYVHAQTVRVTPGFRGKAGCASYVCQRRTSHIITKCIEINVTNIIIT